MPRDERREPTDAGSCRFEIVVYNAFLPGFSVLQTSDEGEDRCRTRTATKKNLRKSEKRRMHNRAVKRTIKTYLKRFLAALEGPVDQLKTEYNLAAKQLDKAAAKRVIHPNLAAQEIAAGPEAPRQDFHRSQQTRVIEPNHRVTENTEKKARKRLRSKHTVGSIGRRLFCILHFLLCALCDSVVSLFLLCRELAAHLRPS